MNRIISAEFIAPDIKRFVIEAPLIARKRKPGQFIIVRVRENGERIPLTIVDGSPETGFITLMVQGIGKTTKTMNLLKAGEFVRDVVGPLGKPTRIEKYGVAVCISGGVGTAEVLPIAKALKEAGNRVITIIGARTKELVIAESEMRAICDEVIITTDDGTYGKKGFVTEALSDILKSDGKPDFVLAVGPLPMMKAIAEMTRPYQIRTEVSLNSIMIDGTGMCGGCRVTVGGQTKFVCVDGPEFDAHQVDFDQVAKRQKQFNAQEKISLDRFVQEHHPCKLDSFVNQPER
ncbi:MAG: ferredoxin-NADP reductase [Candidatus Marinimicrobia bacterium CG08_land_8_20_14_0_20_45_22]|nr:MAG: ferredoxin-NADP reductase [Candidatus Marinimicrobia bacterium CG08_land_8_20_14_0_20_45_22]